MNEEQKIQEIEEIFSYYEKQKDRKDQDMVLALLKELQEIQGFITPYLKQKVMEITGTSETVLKCLIRMCPSIKEQTAKHEILACTGERCAKKDGMEILRKLRKELGLKENGVSADGMFELRTQNCLKKCKTSPNMMIDGIVYSGEELQDLKALLEKIKAADYKKY